MAVTQVEVEPARPLMTMRCAALGLETILVGPDGRRPNQQALCTVRSDPHWLAIGQQARLLALSTGLPLVRKRAPLAPIGAGKSSLVTSQVVT
ncbi:hypothetical protein VTN96DRAFT_4954 [Rasamsonia emersonii]